ncbi:TIGR00730 family Rossman fold protein [Mucilaginibacter gynuensis]|uniref:Cytokinin riboside 5'-monophosphate phosphoribohydrolase n=1 Tax=Mucilaginibacter gynuensis TaxID=1302236 RepID=A0ABP8G105_9SPHI
MKSICVFCGANFNGDEVLSQAIEQLAKKMVAGNISLVFGGGKVGVMGMLADAVLSRGGKAIGIMPQFLIDKEVAHSGLTELHIVKSMHERKQLMSELSDGIITLPGGLGTLEEYFEALTWLQLGLHQNPVGLLNINGFYDLLLQQLDVMEQQKFLKPANRKLVLSSASIDDLFEQMENFSSKPEEVWYNKNGLK